MTQVEKPIPEEEKERYEKWHHELVEKVAETDDKLAEKYLGGEEITEAELRAGLRTATISFKTHPVFCGSALKYVGVQRLLDGVIDYLPNPLDMPAIKGHDMKDPEKIIERHPDPDEPFCGLAFKIVNDQHGDLTYVRVYSGRLEKGSRVLNSNRNKRENISRMFQMHAQDRNPIDVAECRRHRSLHRHQGSPHRRHALRSGQPDHPGASDIPRAGHQHVDRAQDGRRQAEAGRSPHDPQARGPDFPGQLR